MYAYSTTVTLCFVYPHCTALAESGPNFVPSVFVVFLFEHMYVLKAFISFSTSSSSSSNREWAEHSLDAPSLASPTSSNMLY